MKIITAIAYARDYKRRVVPVKWRDFKNELMKGPAFKQAYDDLEPEYEIIKQRIQKGMTQAELAQAGTEDLKYVVWKEGHGIISFPKNKTHPGKAGFTDSENG